MIALKPAVHQYLTMRRALGFKLHDAEKALLDFVTFLEQRRAPYITTAVAVEWAKPAATPSDPRGGARRLTVVRGFARYRHATDARTEIPPPGLLPGRARRLPPYLYRDEDIRALLRTALHLPQHGPRGALRPWTYHVLFGLLAATGLRIGEARNLLIEDVDLQTGVLTIRGTKFGKSRLVPLHATTRTILTAYLAQRDRVWAGQAVAPYVFVSNRGRRLQISNIHAVFYALSRQIGLRQPGQSHGPRLHDLRHRFAVQTLLRWYRTGEVAERRLPVLSAYLGHVRVEETFWYLTAWPELMQAAMHRLERCWEATQ